MDGTLKSLTIGRERNDKSRKTIQGGKEMSSSAHAFTCGMITLTGALSNFVFDNPMGGWILVAVTAILLTISALSHKKEKKKKK